MYDSHRHMHTLLDFVVTLLSGFNYPDLSFTESWCSGWA